nr:MAG TPA: hypothetical protein [Bacteriophage sp.]
MSPTPRDLDKNTRIFMYDEREFSALFIQEHSVKMLAG